MSSRLEVQSFLGEAAAEILNREDLEDPLAAHLGNAQEYPREYVPARRSGCNP